MDLNKIFIDTGMYCTNIMDINCINIINEYMIQMEDVFRCEKMRVLLQKCINTTTRSEKLKNILSFYFFNCKKYKIDIITFFRYIVENDFFHDCMFEVLFDDRYLDEYDVRDWKNKHMIIYKFSKVSDKVIRIVCKKK